MNWLSMVANRLLWFVPTLVGLLAIVFVLSRVIPVDPAVLAAGENASAAQVQQVRERFGFDKPLPIQFANYLRDIAQGNLGTSLFTQQPIVDDRSNGPWPDTSAGPPEWTISRPAWSFRSVGPSKPSPPTDRS